MFDNEYIVSLKRFISDVEIVSINNKLQAYDNVDMIYTLEKREDEFFISLNERGVILEFCKISNKELAQIYFAIFVKRGVTDFEFPLMTLINGIEDIVILKEYLTREKLDSFYSVDSRIKGKINFSSELNKIYYVDASDNEYSLFYLPNRIFQTFYASIVKLKAMKEWLIQLNDTNGLGDQYEATLLGYSSEGVEKF
ncbi:hypothetical protein [Streptococcus oralis]|uniref:Uncharacterized protein n=1 Tax=Streptococcus oralis subsp. oralis TaxID=1891914 RepID=A0A1X1IF30_STROR|nr:hypothetical protein [Streptococcus oralis]ORO47641.1 hypothetical protein B7723_10135 [Streptococcus oralis subsp. oralis]ORO69270.1 hypothetical protein B7713_00305 [Streptococcus oralis subsp. oralis]ORO71785.1 hypothetical protein B7712_03765 [Streptococcus oralis subsp. oralis]